MSKENFKVFVKKYPNLAYYVNNKEMTWQQFYEMYDIYGEDDKVWSKYLKKDDTSSTSTLLGDTSLKEILNIVKKIDLDTVKKGVDGVQKAVNLIQDLSTNKQSSSPSYQRRPMYKYFED